MTLYKAVIAPAASFLSPLQSDTFFGAFCWSYLRLYGQEALEALLALCREQPPVIFSNAFPSGSLPLPFGMYDTANLFEEVTDKARRCKAYQDNKKLKSSRYVSQEAFQAILSGNYHGFTEYLRGDDTVLATAVHNMVSRSSSIVENTDGSGNLFATEEMFPVTGSCYDVYIQTSLPETTLASVLEVMCSLGIGAGKSTGRGIFALKSLEKAMAFGVLAEKANAFVALSNFIPAAADPVKGHYKTFVKFPRLDREFADSGMPFKKPLLFIKCGSLFFINTALREYYGRCIAGVSPLNPKIIVNACTIAVGAVIP